MLIKQLLQINFKALTYADRYMALKIVMINVIANMCYFKPAYTFAARISMYSLTELIRC